MPKTSFDDAEADVFEELDDGWHPDAWVIACPPTEQEISQCMHDPELPLEIVHAELGASSASTPAQASSARSPKKAPKAKAATRSLRREVSDGKGPHRPKQIEMPSVNQKDRQKSDPLKADEEPPEEQPKESATLAKLSRNETEWFRNQARYMFAKDAAGKTKGNDKKKRKAREKATKQWAKLPPATKKIWGEALLKESPGMDRIQVFKEQHPLFRDPDMAKEATTAFYFRGKTGMMTYYSKDWVFDKTGMTGLTVDEAAKSLNQTEQWSKLESTLTNEIAAMLTRSKCHHYSWSFELCPETWSKSTVLRGHLHVGLDWPFEQRVAEAAFFRVGQTAPVHRRSDVLAAGQISSKRKNSCPIHHYLQLPKKGAMMQGTNYKKMTEFHVNPRWILTNYQSQKISYEVAEEVPFF